jgi:hypothetical protein
VTGYTLGGTNWFRDGTFSLTAPDTYDMPSWWSHSSGARLYINSEHNHSVLDTSALPVQSMVYSTLNNTTNWYAVTQNPDWVGWGGGNTDSEYWDIDLGLGGPASSAYPALEANFNEISAVAGACSSGSSSSSGS